MAQSVTQMVHHVRRCNSPVFKSIYLKANYNYKVNYVSDTLILFELELNNIDVLVIYLFIYLIV